MSEIVVDGIRFNDAIWKHRDGSAHSSEGPLGCPVCAAHRRLRYGKTKMRKGGRPRG